MPPFELVALLAIIFIAALLQGGTGFGFGLFGVAALNLVFPDLTYSIPLLAILNAPVVYYVFARLWRETMWSRLLPVMAGVFLGAPFGIFVLTNWPQDLLLRILGVVLLLAAIHSFRSCACNHTNCACAEDAAAAADEAQRNADTLDDSPKGKFLGGGVGVITGALAGAFNTGGPPIIAYVYSRPWTKEQRTSTMQAVFCFSLTYRLIVMYFSGLYTPQLLMHSLYAMPAVVVGMVAGYALFRRIPTRALEFFVAVFLVLVGLKMLIYPNGG